MANLRKRTPWCLSGQDITPEDVYLDRRRFLQYVGAAGAATFVGSPATSAAGRDEIIKIPKTPTSNLYPANRNKKYVLDRPLTKELVAAKYINFYEFTTDKTAVWRMVDKFQIRPWTVEVTGLVHKPQRFDIDALVRKMPLEERLYRHRCVETWAMAVPWTGFPLKALIDLVQPKASAKFVRFVSFKRLDEAPGQRQLGYPWPYYEGLSIEEATNELTLLVTGIYGHQLPKQHGAPLRLVAPWKYGFKSIKSIERIEFLDHQPQTFWNDIAPREYSFHANVEPSVPHPRWSQENEWMIPNRKHRRKTQLFNGYQTFVGDMYR